MDPTSSSLDKILDWANAFHEHVADVKGQNLTCFVRSFDSSEKTPFEFVQKRNVVVEFFVDIGCAVRAFFGIGPKIDGLVDVSEKVTEEVIEAKYATKEKEASIGEAFSSLRDLFSQVEKREGKWSGKTISNKLHEEKKRLTELFEDCILKKIVTMLEGASITILQEGGEISFALKGTSFESHEALLTQFGVTDPFLQREIRSKLDKTDAMQELFEKAFIAFYEGKCQSAGQKIQECLSAGQRGWLGTRKVTLAALEESSGTIKALEDGYFEFLETIGKYSSGKEPLLAPETMETLSKKVEDKYTEIWDGLRTKKDDFAVLTLCHNHIIRADGLVGTINGGLKGISSISEDRAGPMIECLDRISKSVVQIQGYYKGKNFPEEVLKKADEVKTHCDEAIQRISDLVSFSVKKEEKGAFGKDLEAKAHDVHQTIIIQGPMQGGQINQIAAANIGKIVQQSYVDTARKAAEVYQKENPSLKDACGQALSEAAGPVLIGLCFGGLPGMATAALSVATALLARSVVETIGDKLNLPKGITSTLGFMAFLATSAYSSQYINAYLQSRTTPQKEVPVQPKVPEPAPKLSTGYSPGKEPIASKEMAAQYKPAPQPVIQEVKVQQKVAPTDAEKVQCGRWCRAKEHFAQGRNIGRAANKISLSIATADVFGVLSPIKEGVGALMQDRSFSWLRFLPTSWLGKKAITSMVS